MNQVKVMPNAKNPAVDIAVAEEQAHQQAMTQTAANAQITPVTLIGLLKIRDVDGTGRLVKQEFQVPLPKDLQAFDNVANIIWKNFSEYGGLNIPDPDDKKKFHFFPMENFEKVTLEFGTVSGITLA